MSLHVAASLLALVSCGGLLILVFRYGLDGNRSIQIFSLYLLDMLLMQAALLMVSIADNTEKALFWYTVLIPLGALQPIIYLFFTRSFLGIRRFSNLISINLLISLSTVAVGLIFTQEVVYTEIHRHQATGLFIPEFGPFVAPLVIPVILFWSLAALNLVIGYRDAEHSFQRRRIQYLLLGMLLVGGGIFANFISELQPYPVELIANVANAFLIAYAILRYQLLDIQVVVRRGLLYSLLTTILGVTYFLVIYFATRFFHFLTNAQIFLLSLIVATIAAVAAQPLRNSVQRWVDRLFFREQYDSNEMIQRLSHTVISVLDLKKLTTMILEDTTTTMHIEWAALFLIEDEGECLYPVAQKGLNSATDLRLRKGQAIFRWLSNHETTLVMNDPARMLGCETVNGQEVENWMRVGVKLFVPLRARDELIGTLAVGSKRSQQPYSQNDESTLATLANQTAIAIDNARLYERARQEIAERERLAAQLLHAQKMEAVGLLAGGIAHDFNNLLTAINGFAELVQLQLPPGDPSQEMVGNIQTAGQRASDLVRQLLAFSRKQIIKPQTLDLNRIVTDMDKMLRPIIGEDIQIKTVLAPTLWLIEADPTQIEQIIVNLAVNARDAMPNGGKLTVETSNIVLNENYVNSYLEAQLGEYVQLTISDTGIGMSKEVQARIFEPFFTTKEMGRGTGLGLATVYGVVRQSGGHICVESEEDQGTVFKVYFPRAKDAGNLQRRDEKIVDLPRGMETILLVEDEAAVRELMTITLRKQGYKILAATNGREALDLVQDHKGEIQLLLTDVVMPQMNGPELARQLQAQRPQIRVLYISGYTDKAINQDTILTEGVAFLSKPFGLKRLIEKVRDVLDSEGEMKLQRF